MTTPTNADCGCLIEYEGDAYQQAWSIDYCPRHSEATAAQRDRLLEALRNQRSLHPSHCYCYVCQNTDGILAAQPETQEA